ncbi:MAG: DUF6519 domain-containing protein [Dongiaceae bacterium]
MKGDFSRWSFDPAANFSGVLHQQGRVRTDADDNDRGRIDAHWRLTAARDVIGDGLAAAPAAAPGGFRVVSAKVAAGAVTVRLEPGRLWADGLHLYLPPGTPVDLPADYLAPPLQAPQATVASIAAGVRDAVVLEVWEESISAFQEPLLLLEPALGGPDTTERSRVVAAVKLMRLGANEDCSAVAKAADDFSAKGKLTVTPSPAILIPGDCPVEAGGGYTGFEHYLYRIEIAEPAAGQARFKWSRFNGGLVGRGRFTAGAPGTGTVTITANDQAINHCDLDSFYLEALDRDPVFGGWRVVASADATRPQDGQLALTNIQGAWPAPATGTAFFRLWDGIARIADFPGGPTPAELADGIRLAFDAPAAGNLNYAPGDYWTFPVRAAGTPFDPALLPSNAPPQGIHHHRVALAEITWNSALAAAADQGEIEDCRHVFPPLARPRGCCNYSVGDGVTSHGDFDSIEAAIQALPASGGQICLLPGLHQTNAVIRNRRDIRIHGCHRRTKVVPRKGASTDPIFRISQSVGIVLEAMDMVTLGGTGILIDAEKPGGSADIEIGDNRILACQSAVRAVNAEGLWIHHNLIRMLDKRGGGPAIELSADDSLVERNDIRLIPAPAMPPIETPDDPDPVDPNDPCARLEVVYVNPRIFGLYVDRIWKLPLAVLVPLQPYRAQGGIQLDGGCERVRLLENRIVGGAGNGVTLGSGGTAVPPPEPAPLPVITMPREARIVGRVLGPDGQGVPGAQLTLTRQSDGQARTIVADANAQFTAGLVAGKYSVDASAPGLDIDKVDLRQINDSIFALTVVLKKEEPAPSPVPAGFLYEIAIERNRIEAMGRSGIGLPPAGRRAAGASLASPVIGLEIRGNRIRGCLLNPFDGALQAEAQQIGLGGISLGLCADVAIAGNRIEGNGPTAADPACGIFVLYGENLEIAANEVLENGALPRDFANLVTAPGRRGGIVIELASGFNLLAGLAAGALLGARQGRRPAARLHENVVVQPAGQALRLLAFGPVACTDNSLGSDLSGPGPVDLLAGTVLIFDLAGTQQAAAGVQLGGANAAQPTAFARGPGAQLLPGGGVLFADNQGRTGPANRSVTCQLVAALDDAGYQGNQSLSERSGNLFANVVVFGGTLRAVGNRFAERGPETLLSLFTLAARMNDTSLNQGDHCIIAVDQNPAMTEVKVGNQVLDPGPLCARFAERATLAFKPQG